MKFFEKKVNEDKSEKRSWLNWVNPIFGVIRYTNSNSYTSAQNLKLSTVYRCVNLISDSIASMPLYPYIYKDNWKYINEDSTLFNLLNVQPNAIIGAYMFKKLIVTNMLLNGVSYIYIDRNSNGVINSLVLLNSTNIKPIIKNNDLFYEDSVNNKIYDKSQVISILNYTEDGITGISTISYAVNALENATYQDGHAKNYFKNGANITALLKPQPGSNLSPQQLEKAKNAIISQTNIDGGGGLIVLDGALDLSPLSINPKDSQLLESRQFNVDEICRFFNVPPSLAFSNNQKYSTVELQQIDFLNNCLQPLIEKIENEMFRKLFLKSEWDISELRFDTSNLLRLDAQTQASVFTQYFNCGAMTVNEIRERINAKFPIKNGNRSFIGQNMQPTDNILNDIKNQKNNDIENE